MPSGTTMAAEPYPESPVSETVIFEVSVTVPLVDAAVFRARCSSSCVVIAVALADSLFSAANAVIGTKLITIHNDRNAAKNFLFTCVFLLVLYSSSVYRPSPRSVCYTVWRYCGLVYSSYHLMVMERLQPQSLCIVVNQLDTA